MFHKSVLAMAVAPILSLGCDDAPNPTVPVTGVVTLEGKPGEGASVDFIPEDASKGRPATAITNENGEFEMSTYSRGDGVVPGTHKVTVNLNQPGTKMIIAEAPSNSAIPLRYTRPQTTPFEFEIKEGEEAKHIELEITRKGQR